MRTILGAIGVLALLAGGWHIVSLHAENQALRAAAARPAAAPSTVATGAAKRQRMLSDEHRELLYAELSVESGQKVWFVRQPKDREADSFQSELEAVFLESGWEVAGSTESINSLRAGVRVFAADDVLADHISVAVTGLRIIGLEVFAGTGYRAFYQKQKEKDPKFSGVELALDQDFVIVVGPNPPAP